VANRRVGIGPAVLFFPAVMDPRSLICQKDRQNAFFTAKTFEPFALNFRAEPSPKHLGYLGK
jgi:hypothetical protein